MPLGSTSLEEKLQGASSYTAPRFGAETGAKRWGGGRAQQQGNAPGHLSEHQITFPVTFRGNTTQNSGFALTFTSRGCSTRCFTNFSLQFLLCSYRHAQTQPTSYKNAERRSVRQ